MQRRLAAKTNLRAYYIYKIRIRKFYVGKSCRELNYIFKKNHLYLSSYAKDMTILLNATEQKKQCSE